MIDNEDLYDRIEAMSDEYLVNTLDPIAAALHGKRKVFDGSGIEIRANRAIALAVLDLYQEWQREIYLRD